MFRKRIQKSCLCETDSVVTNIKGCVKCTKEWRTKNPNFRVVVKFVFRIPGIKDSPGSRVSTRIGAIAID